MLLSDFIFQLDLTDDDTEGIVGYRVGGYHPVVLGEVLAGRKDRYRILHKLGYTGLCTIWLAENTRTQLCVAVKISTAAEYIHHTNEAQMLRTAAHPNIITLLDDFVVEGPNGIHGVVVSEVVIPMPALIKSFSPSPAWRKAYARGIVEGLVHLHSLGVVHGVLRFKSVGVSVQGLDVRRVLQQAKDAVLYIATPRRMASYSETHPVYLVRPCDSTKLLGSVTDIPPDAKTFDLDVAHGVQGAQRQSRYVAGANPPETAFLLATQSSELTTIGMPGDVWALGEILHELYSGRALFYAFTMRQILIELALIMGRAPGTWRRAVRATARTTRARADKLWAERRELLRPACGDDDDADRLVALLRRIFVLDPADRPTATEILADPWFQSL